MNWGAELWVKLYTRDTLGWKRLGFEARTVFLHALRKCDRTGFLECDGLGPPGLALLLDAPDMFTLIGLRELVRYGSLVAEGSGYRIPKFTEAQEARTSDAVRKKMSRDRVTARHSTSQDVTACDDEMRRDKNRNPLPIGRGGAGGIAEPQAQTQTPSGKPSGKPKQANKGTRCPESTDPKARAWCEGQGIEWCQEARRMLDHFAAQPGAKGVKLRWGATWRNWQIKASEMKNGSSGMRGKVQPPREGASPWNPDYV